ncbi:MAG: AAA family ATPase [Pseudomonadota bacterium]
MKKEYNNFSFKFILVFHLLFLPLFAENSDVCSNEKLFLETMKPKQEALENTETILINLLDNKLNEKIPINLIFFINPKNPEDVANRITELENESQNYDIYKDVFFKEIHGCQNKNKKIKTKLNELVLLQKNIIELKLNFLKIPLDKRIEIIDLNFQISAHSETSKKLSDVKEDAIQRISEADKNIEEARSKIQLSIPSNLKELIYQQNILENLSKEIAKLSLELSNKLNDKTIYYNDTLDKLIKIDKQLNKSFVSLSDMKLLYYDITNIWRSFVDKASAYLDLQKNFLPIPEIPQKPNALLSELKDNVEVNNYNTTFAKLEKERSSLANLQLELYELDKNNYYDLLLKVNRSRSLMHQRIIKYNYSTIYNILDIDYVNDLIREIRIVPNRYIALFLSKYLEIKNLVSSGFDGIIKIVFQLVLLLSILLIPFGIYYSAKIGTTFLDSMRSNIIRSRNITKFSSFLALWIQRINVYLPWIIILIGLSFIKNIIKTTAFAGIETFLPYFCFYVYYRVLKLFLATTISKISIDSNKKTYITINKEIKKTTHFLGIIFLIYVSILYTAESIIGKALIYNIVNNIMFFIGYFVISFAFVPWRDEISFHLLKFVPDKTKNIIEKTIKSKLFILFAFLYLLIIFAYYVFQRTAEKMGEFDFSKKISAKLFRRKLETAAKNIHSDINKTLPEDYISIFKTYESLADNFLVSIKNDLTDKIESQIENWINDKSEEDSIALYGEKGSGKSTLLRSVKNKYSKLNIVYAEITEKLTTKNQVLSYFEDLLSIPLKKEGVAELVRTDTERKKTLIIIDNAHNLFLSKRKGFDGFHTFIDLINAQTQNIFWLAAFNNYSWFYLVSVFGKNRYFRLALKMPPWSETELKTMVMTRHQNTNYSLKYDPILYATGKASSFNQNNLIEEKFFRLLWEQSDGIPRAAINIWLSSLKPSYGKIIQVGLPKETNKNIFSILADEIFFVYAAIIRHENISTYQIIETTDMPEGTVRYALKYGIENGFLTKTDKGVYRINSEWSKDLCKLLEWKNLIYGY